ncbi:hypothetical protein HDV57DRAFT_491496 [Trichoderma longibrachiatum]|uniref:Uncharacterized protein n=1 Tax=Trichoderma longibrachiatum ATCC 18648 TaxID=983965 RepID=A0A2T4C236_TRILO|nr:hypothetical protein M440DRAFT_1402118 [Trichoderma longibrachiatum ATCC 18648]
MAGGAQDDTEVPGRQTALTLACGHIVYYDYLERAQRNDHGDGVKLECFSCEAVMECRRRGHLPRRVPIPRAFDGLESVNILPLTPPEGGASPSKCASCMAWMAREVEEVLQVLRDEQREEPYNPVGEAVRRVLQMFMDDMEKENLVELSLEDVLLRLQAPAANNVLVVCISAGRGWHEGTLWDWDC